MNMKKILTLFVLLAGLLSACDKPAKEEAKTTLSVSVSGISIQTASVSASAEGAAPSLVRMIGATLLDDMLSEVASLDDEAKVKAFLTKYGSAVELPYESVLKDLAPDSEYVVGLISFNKNMDPTAFAVTTFRTDVFGSVTTGDPSGAGTVKENIL